MGDEAQDRILGTEGEAIAHQILQSIPGAREVLDVRDNDAWKKRGADFLLVLERKTVAVEVKYEAKHTGNLVLETYSVTEARIPGWWFTSHSQFVLYGFKDTSQWYAVDLAEARRAVELEKLASSGARTMGSHSTSFRLLPLNSSKEFIRPFAPTTKAPGGPKVTSTGDMSDILARLRAVRANRQGQAAILPTDWVARARSLVQRNDGSWDVAKRSCGRTKRTCEFCGTNPTVRAPAHKPKVDLARIQAARGALKNNPPRKP